MTLAKINRTGLTISALGFSPNEAEVIFVNTSNSGNVPDDIFKIDYDELFEVDDRELLIEDAKMPDWE